MKRMIVLLAVAAALGGCQLFHKEGASGSGKTKAEKRSLSGFKAVNISGAFEVEIVAQKEAGVELEGDDNLLPLVRTEVNDGVLSIFNDRSYSTSDAIRVRISVPQLDAVSTSGASDIVVTNVKSDDFNVSTSGAGSLKISGEARTLDLEISGAGSVDTKDLRAARVSVDSSGAAEADVYASEELRVSASGAGSVNYYGDPKNVSESVSGGASVSKR
ncbi:MAG TPA: head GIN domain-containing protein [Pyrinomonadaceae bacterium]|nr:head GIN domain-containing protein [Pyrinomonadaceae bacterium]